MNDLRMEPDPACNMNLPPMESLLDGTNGKNCPVAMKTQARFLSSEPRKNLDREQAKTGELMDPIKDRGIDTGKIQGEFIPCRSCVFCRLRIGLVSGDDRPGADQVGRIYQISVG